MAESNSTQKKPLDNVEKRTQGLYSSLVIKPKAEHFFLFERIDCLEKWHDLHSYCSCFLERFHKFYQEFFGKDLLDTTEKISMIADFRTDRKKFIENIHSVKEELEAELEKREKKIKSVQGKILNLQGILDLCTDEMEYYYHCQEMNGFDQQIEEEEKVKMQIQKLIQTLKDSLPEIFENRRLRSKLEEKDLEIQTLVSEKVQLKWEIQKCQDMEQEKVLEFNNLETEKDNVERKNQKLENMVQEKDLEILNRATEKDNIERKNEKLENMVQELKATNTQLCNVTKSLEDNFQREITESKEEIKKFEKEKMKLTDHVQELRKQIGHEQEDFKDCKRKFHLLENLCYRNLAENEQLRAEKDKVTEILRRQSEHACELSRRNVELKEQLSAKDEAISTCLEFGYTIEMINSAIKEWEMTHRYKAEDLVKILMDICREAVVLPERQEVSSHRQNRREASMGDQSEGAVRGEDLDTDESFMDSVKERSVQESIGNAFEGDTIKVIPSSCRYA